MRVIGEGCGHTIEDMCIQLGPAAEYYIRTGRGRKITREEAFDICKQAEKEGYGTFDTKFIRTRKCPCYL